MSFVLSGCATTKGGVACDGWKPIKPTVDDIFEVSDGLARDILAHNKHGQSIGCWKGMVSER